MPLLTHALDYAVDGWPVIPVRGKIPTTPHGSKDWTIDPRTIAKQKWHGIGLVTGILFWVLDIDGPEGIESMARILHENELPTSPVAQTRNGCHYYFLIPPRTRKPRNAVGVFPGVDIRGVGGYVVAPPSPHPKGGTYKWIVSPLDADLEPAPGWLHKALRNELNKKKPKPRPGGPPPKSGEFALSSIGVIGEHTRNAKLYKYACAAASRGRNEEQITNEIEWLNTNRCYEPLPDREIACIVRSASKYIRG